MFVAYHDFRLNNEPFIDGANLYSAENSKLISEFNGAHFDAQPHDIRNVISGKANLSKLRSNDVVVSNAGPYAFAYHYLREKKGLKFRIIRDVQTSFWPGYFLQEKLCGRYIRKNDAVLFLSEFQRQLFIKIFPESLNANNTFVCAPLMHFFPKNLPRRANEYDGLTVGWLGRVTREKGFDTAFNAFISLKKQRNDVRMVVAGDRMNPELRKYVRSKLQKGRISTDCFTHLNDKRFMSCSSIWNVYRKFDVFLFPSVSSNESLGRVIIEAAYCGLPIIATNYAAAPELLDKKNLLNVNYKKGFLQLSRTMTCGKVDLEEGVKKVLDYKKLSKGADISRYKNHDLKYLRILKGEQKKDAGVILTKDTMELIDGVRMYQDDISAEPKRSFERLRAFLMSQNYAILGLWHHYIPAYMGYNPYAVFFGDKEHTLLERTNIKFQKFFMRAKIPIDAYFEKYRYFKRTRVAKRRGY